MKQSLYFSAFATILGLTAFIVDAFITGKTSIHNHCVTLQRQPCKRRQERRRKCDFHVICNMGQYNSENNQDESDDNAEENDSRSSSNNNDDGWWSRRDFLVSNTVAMCMAGAAGTTTAASVLLGNKIPMEAQAVAATTSDRIRTATKSDGAIIGPLVPFSTRRKYKHITLENGLRVLLVSDKKTPRCSAALSIGGAGQFSDKIPGQAHLMEHMILSSANFGKRSYDDFEDWIADRDGASNAFTGPGLVCFHFSSPSDVFQEAVECFSTLFVQDTIEQTLQNEGTIRREVRRVDSELDFSTFPSRSFYLLKHFMNVEHPFAKFSAGSYDTLEKDPKAAGINVGQELFEFYKQRYRADRSVLVVVAPTDLGTLERLVAPYAGVLSKETSDTPKFTPFPKAFGNNPRGYQLVLQRSKSDMSENIEKLSFEWPLKILYNGIQDQLIGPQLVGAPAVGCIISQILLRRGPGSLYLFLLRRGWVLPGQQGVPRISFPVDLSGFQILKLEIALSLDGFANRSAVIAAVYNSIDSVVQISPPGQPFLLSRDLMASYITSATLYGYALAPRPPDAVELAIDAETYGIGGENGVGVEGVWPIMPSVDNNRAVDALRRAVADTLALMSNPSKAIVIISASNKAILSSSSLVDQALPPASSRLWKVEPISGGRYYAEDMMGLAGLVEMWVADKMAEDEIGPPKPNPLLPTRLRPVRPILERRTSNGGRRYFYLDDTASTSSSKISAFDKDIPRDAVWREFLTQAPDSTMYGNDYDTTWEARATASQLGDNWKLWQVAQSSDDVVKLPLPAMPTEPSCRCSLVLQLLSSRPARANVQQGAQSQLWLLSFENAIEDLAELGAPGGLAYDISFNKFGIRICFLGISQNLPSYARRFCRRLVEHHKRLIEGSTLLSPDVVDLAVLRAKRLNTVSKLRKRQIIGSLVDSTATDAAIEGATFLSSCTGALCLAQGDLLPKEALSLLEELKAIFKSYVSDDGSIPLSARPSLSSIVYRPMWKPRGASSCSISGIPLVSDACGRVRR